MTEMFDRVEVVVATQAEILGQVKQDIQVALRLLDFGHTEPAKDVLRFARAELVELLGRDEE